MSCAISPRDSGAVRLRSIAALAFINSWIGVLGTVMSLSLTGLSANNPQFKCGFHITYLPLLRCLGNPSLLFTRISVPNDSLVFSALRLANNQLVVFIYDSPLCLHGV